MLYMRVTFRRVEAGQFRYWQAVLDNGYRQAFTQAYALKSHCRAAAIDKATAAGRVPLFM